MFDASQLNWLRLEWELRDPWFLLLLPLVPFVFWLGTRKSSSLGFSSLKLLEHTSKSWRMRAAKLPALIMSLATALMIFALARPRTPERETRVARDGIAIMMVVDLSSSMNARDLVPEDRTINRLDVVKDVFADFVMGGGDASAAGRPDDLVGLVTFAGYADSVCPLTLDHGNLTSIVRDLSIVDVQSEDGTAIGDGLGLGIERLRRSKAKSRVLILLTDGVNNSGAIAPQKAAELAAELGIKVYCIGAGTNGMAMIPIQDVFGRTRLTQQPVNIDEETLKQISVTTGGKYYRAQDRESLANVYSEIDALEKTEVSEMRYLQYEEHFAQIVTWSLALLALAAILEISVFRKLP